MAFRQNESLHELSIDVLLRMLFYMLYMKIAFHLLYELFLYEFLGSFYMKNACCKLHSEFLALQDYLDVFYQYAFLIECWI